MGRLLVSSPFRCLRLTCHQRHRVATASRRRVTTSFANGASAPMPSSTSPPLLPSSLYASLVSASALTADAAQQSVLPLLDALTLSLIPHQSAMADYWQRHDAWHALRQRRIAEEVQRRTAFHSSPPTSPTHTSLLSRFSSLLSSSSDRPSPTTHHPLPPPELLPDDYYRLPPQPIAPPPPRGLYLHGSVGSGKTLLMDLLFASTASLVSNRRRVHWHGFMLQLFALLHQHHQLPRSSASPVSPSSPSRHAMDFVVDVLTPERHLLLLAFDEVQMTDPAEMALIQGLFHRLFQRGVVLIATGNRPAADLDRSQVRGPDFQRMLDQWKTRSHFVELGTGRDWRREKRAVQGVGADGAGVYELVRRMGGDQGGAFPVAHWLTDEQIDYLLSVPSFPYFHPLTPTTAAQLDDLYTHLVALAPGPLIPSSPVQLPLPHGRVLDVAVHHPSGVCRIEFPALCARPLGAADYLALTARHHTVVVEGVPRLGLDRRDLLRRLITLVDQAYNHNALLVMSMEGQGVEGLEEGGDVGEVAEAVEGAQFELEAMRRGVGSENRDPSRGGSLFSGEDERFALKRCVSRLQEMGSRAYMRERRWKATAQDTPPVIDSTSSQMHQHVLNSA